MQRSEILRSELPYLPPYDWAAVLNYFRVHAIPQLEMVDACGYERAIQMGRGFGWFRVENDPGRNVLLVSIWNGGEDDLLEISTSVRRMFDLDAEPLAVASAMSCDKFLKIFWHQHPGLRVARAWSAWESLIATILGQLVSIGLGRMLLSELMLAAGPAVFHPKTGAQIALFPSAQRKRAVLAGCTPDAFGLTMYGWLRLR